MRLRQQPFLRRNPSEHSIENVAAHSTAFAVCCVSNPLGFLFSATYEERITLCPTGGHDRLDVSSDPSGLHLGFKGGVYGLASTETSLCSLRRARYGETAQVHGQIPCEFRSCCDYCCTEESALVYSPSILVIPASLWEGSHAADSTEEAAVVHI